MGAGDAPPESGVSTTPAEAVLQPMAAQAVLPDGRVVTLTAWEPTR